jgi:hypothetical protein
MILSFKSRFIYPPLAWKRFAGVLGGTFSFFIFMEGGILLDVTNDLKMKK